MGDEPKTELEVVRPKGAERLDARLADGNRVLAPADWQMLSAIAETVNDTEFIPEKLRGSAPRVLACMLYGHALGISPMIALKEIAVIDGTPSMSSALMVAKVLEAGHTIERVEIRGEDGEMTGTTANGTRSDGRTDSYTFTIAMARRAGLMGKKNWQNYPEAMLWWRASSQLCSFLFPDVFMGSPYNEEELGADLNPPGATLEPGGVVRLVAVEEPEAGPNQDGALNGPEGPGGPPAAGKTPEELALELTARLEGRSEPAEEVEGEVVDEDFWTPLDERDPTLEEYEFAVGLIANPVAGNYASDDDMEEALAAAQTLVEAYGEAREKEAAVAPIVARGTAAELMLQVAEAQNRGDVEWLEAMLANEESASRPRIRLVAGLKEAIAVAKGEQPAPPAEPVEPEEGQPEETAFTPGAEDVDTAAAQLESNPSGHQFDPTVPLDQLDHLQLVMRARAVIGYMTASHPDEKAWKYEAVVAAASNLWKLPVHTLDELESWHLVKILEAAPEEATQTLAHMSGEYVEKLAATVTGSNPS